MTCTPHCESFRRLVNSMWEVFPTHAPPVAGRVRYGQDPWHLSVRSEILP